MIVGRLSQAEPMPVDQGIPENRASVLAEDHRPTSERIVKRAATYGDLLLMLSSG